METRITDVLVMGGGVIGLSTAIVLARLGFQVEVVDQSEPGREASWAGAGMLPPGDSEHAVTWKEWLRGASASRWPAWVESIRGDSGLDVGFRPCGALEVATSHEQERELSQLITDLKRQCVEVELLSGSDLRERFPDVQVPSGSAWWLREFAQVRNPRLLKALIAVCHHLGVRVTGGRRIRGFQSTKGRIEAAVSDDGLHTAGHFVLATGAWSQALGEQVGVQLGVSPVRGQMLLLETRQRSFSAVIEVGRRYLVPRGDGRILVGSTEERVGFEKGTTAAAIRGLLDFGTTLVPSLKEARFLQAWSGLRPGRLEGVPWIGRSPEYHNLVIAAGHFRDGLQLSPLTADLVGRLVSGQVLEIPDRFAESHPELCTGR